MNCGRDGERASVSPSSLSERALLFPLILFFLGQPFIPLAGPTYRRPTDRQSIIRRRSSRDCTAGRKLSRSLICPPACLSRPTVGRRIRIVSVYARAYLGQVFRPYSVKIARAAATIEPSLSIRSRHADSIGRIERPISDFTLLLSSLFSPLLLFYFSNSTRD